MICMKKKYCWLALIIGLFSVWIFSCDAPRNNPLDPQNPKYPFAQIEGRVKTLSLPHLAIGGAEIVWKNDHLLWQSGSDGFFKIEELEKKDGWLLFHKTKFHADSIFIAWQGEKNKSVECLLNALPTLDSLVFFSCILNRYPNLQNLELTVRARISDNDNDIDTVRFTNADLKFSTHLIFDTVDDFFEQERITMAKLGIPSAEMLIGKEFQIVVRDKFAHQVTIERTMIKRIIRDEVNLKSPLSHDTVSVRPTLRWEPVTPGFLHEYLVEIRTDETDPQLVWQREHLPSTASSVTVESDLSVDPIDSYIWAVWIIDEFGNRARSKYKSFIVKE